MRMTRTRWHAKMRPDPTAWYLHARLHARLPTARCVMHLHSKYATALACLADPTLLPIDKNTMRFFGRVALDANFTGMALCDREGDRVADLLAGGKSVLLLANHGVLVIGSSVAAAFDEMYYFERAAETLMTCYTTGKALRVVSDEIAATTGKTMARLRTACHRSFGQRQSHPRLGGTCVSALRRWDRAFGSTKIVTAASSTGLQKCADRQSSVPPALAHSRSEMNGTLILVELAGHVGLLLWGTHMVGTGVQRGFGSVLRRWLGRNLASAPRAFLTGIGITTLLQSSTATGLLATSFTATGVIALAPALAVMLGANVGTALLTQLLSLNMALVGPPLVLVGVLAFRWAAAARAKNVGRIAIGLGLMLMALAGLVHTLAPLENAPLLRPVMGSLSGDPILAVLLAALLTWACHSSIAIVLLVGSFEAGHVVGPTGAPGARARSQSSGERCPPC